MKRMAMLLAEVLLTVGLAVSAHAYTITDVTTFSNSTAFEGYLSHGFGAVNKLESPTLFPLSFDHLSWRHQFSFDPAPLSIKAAKLSLDLSDDGDTSFEVALLDQEGRLLPDIFSVSDGDREFRVALGTLLNGEYEVTLISLLGDFYLNSSTLLIDYQGAPVPEPATVLLVGAGLFCLAIYCKRRKSSQA